MYALENKALPTDKKRTKLLESLQGRIAQSFDDLEHGWVHSIKEVRKNLGI